MNVEWVKCDERLPECEKHSCMSQDVTVWVDGFGSFAANLAYREDKPYRWLIWPFGDAIVDLIPESHKVVTHWVPFCFSAPIGAKDRFGLIGVER